MQKALDRSALEFRQVVLQMGDVSRIDSTGMGLLVRFLVHLRGRGGDLRLAEPTEFIRTMLGATKLSTVFRTYTSEDEAVLSFLREPAASGKQKAHSGPTVLFLDQSADLCVFARSLLEGHGYPVVTTCRMRDAKMLLTVGGVSLVILGPEHSELQVEAVLSSFAAIAPATSVRFLERGFKHLDAAEAGKVLLGVVQQPSESAAGA